MRRWDLWLGVGVVTQYATAARVLLCAAVVVAVISGRLGGSAHDRKALEAATGAGAGALSCDRWLSEREAQTRTDPSPIDETMMIAWVQGFLAGATGMGHIFSLTTPEERREEVSAGWTFTPPDPQAIRLWLDTHCREYPLKSLNDASLALVVTLLPKKK